MSYATLPGRVAFRNTVNGSFYIQALITELKPGREIDIVLKCVTRNVREMLDENEHMNRVDRYQHQLPFHLTSAMEKGLKF